MAGPSYANFMAHSFTEAVLIRDGTRIFDRWKCRAVQDGPFFLSCNFWQVQKLVTFFRFWKQCFPGGTTVCWLKFFRIGVFKTKTTILQRNETKWMIASITKGMTIEAMKISWLCEEWAATKQGCRFKTWYKQKFYAVEYPLQIYPSLWI